MGGEQQCNNAISHLDLDPRMSGPMLSTHSGARYVTQPKGPHLPTSRFLGLLASKSFSGMLVLDNFGTSFYSAPEILGTSLDRASRAANFPLDVAQR